MLLANISNANDISNKYDIPWRYKLIGQNQKRDYSQKMLVLSKKRMVKLWKTPHLQAWGCKYVPPPLHDNVGPHPT